MVGDPDAPAVVFSDPRLKKKVRPEAIVAAPPGLFSTALILAIILSALGLTGYGFFTLEKKQLSLWPEDELLQFALVLAVPAALLFGLSFWRRWTTLAVCVVVGTSLITFGPANIL